MVKKNFIRLFKNFNFISKKIDIRLTDRPQTISINKFLMNTHNKNIWLEVIYKSVTIVHFEINNSSFCKFIKISNVPI